jgi:hypothetical protein
MEPQENEQDDRHTTPTAYLYYKSVATVAKTFSMGRRRELGCSMEGVHAGVVDDDVDILIEPEHLYEQPWETERVNK